MAIEILEPGRLCYWGEFIDLQPGAIDALALMAAEVNASPDLAQIFAEFYEKNVIREGWQRQWIPIEFHPEVKRALGEDGSLFYLLAYLSGLPKAWEKYERLGIEAEIFRATMLDFQFYVQDYYDEHGRWGFNEFLWIWRHLAVELFRLGRMQYMLLPFSGGVKAFRRKSSGQYLLAADPDLPLRVDGYAWGSGRPDGAEIPPEDETAWRPLFEETEVGWTCHIVNPQGWVEPSPTLLPADEWELALQKGDLVLDLHIPRRDPFNPDTCRDSYAQAQRFFSQKFPDKPYKALFCHTWMFSFPLTEILPIDSNINKFQREFYLYPYPGTLPYLWRFVFGFRHKDLAAAPRNTGLRRAVLEWMDGGGQIFDLPGVLFHPADQWGSQPYVGEFEAASVSLTH